MNCPTCRAALRSMMYEGVDIHTCDGCGGEFVGPEQLSQIIQTREARFGGGVEQALRTRRPSFGAPADTRALDCPGCGGKTRTINYGGDTGVSVDRCVECGGLWLDHDELELVQGLLERWADDATSTIRAHAQELEKARKLAAARVDKRFQGSRFSFVNALINRVLDAA